MKYTRNGYESMKQSILIGLPLVSCSTKAAHSCHGKKNSNNLCSEANYSNAYNLEHAIPNLDVLRSKPAVYHNKNI